GMNDGAGWPRPSMVLTSASDAVRSMSTNATRARCAHRCSTIEAPIPLPPPVTKATRASRLGYEADRIMKSLPLARARLGGVATARGASARGGRRVSARRRRMAVGVPRHPALRARADESVDRVDLAQRERRVDAGRARLAPILSAHAAHDDHRGGSGDLVDG